MKPSPSKQGGRTTTLENTACVFMLAFKASPGSSQPNAWDMSRPAFIWGISPSTPVQTFTWSQAFYIYHQCLSNKAKFNTPIPVACSFKDTEPPSLRSGDSAQELLLLAALFEAYQVGDAVIIHGMPADVTPDLNNVSAFLAAVALMAKKQAAPPTVSLSPALESYLKENVPKPDINLS